MKQIIFILAALTMSLPVLGKELYVNADIGDDSVSYANNSATTPWATLRRAVFGADSWDLRNTGEAAQAGDTVYVAAGIYYAPGSNSRAVPSFMNVNSGNAVDGYITYQAQGSVELRLSSGQGSVIGAYSVGNIRNDYIKWSGFYIDETFAPHSPDTGAITVFSSHHVIIENCTVRGVTTQYGDNHNGIRFEGASFSVARNNLISGIHDRGAPPNDTDATEWHHNNAGIMLYSSHDILMENNEITDTGSGIFPKGLNNYNITIRKNLIHNVRKGIRVTYADSAGQNYIVQNVIRDGINPDNIGIQLSEYAKNYIVANNTIVNIDNGIYIAFSDDQESLVIRNNIIVNSVTALNAWQSATRQYTTDNNNYYINSQWADSGNIYTSLQAWQTAINGETSSILSDPQFVNLTGNDFHLLPGSPAATLGIDLLDLDGDSQTNEAIPAGAYVLGNEIIGRTGDTLAPNPPVLLSVE